MAIPSRDRLDDSIDADELEHDIKEGDEHATTVIDKTFEVLGEDAVSILRTFADMNMRGLQVTTAFYEVCGDDVDEFVDRVRRRDVEMVHAVNAFLADDFPYRAVVEGASADVPPVFEVPLPQGPGF